MRIRLTEVALSHLMGVRDWSEAHWGPAQADRFLKGLATAMERLRTHPTIGRRRDALLPGLRVVRCRPYGIYYLIEDGVVRVIAVLHESRDITTDDFDPPGGGP